jgi:hypothetical protein
MGKSTLVASCTFHQISSSRCLMISLTVTCLKLVPLFD